MTFTNPMLLWGLLLGGIPILIWLWNRQRHRTAEWAAMEFLLRAMKKNRRRLRIENLLLLLCRIAVICLLALALARPVAEGGVLPGSRPNQRAIVVLDGSYSMGYKVGTRTMFERARESAEALVREGLGEGSRVSLAIVEDEPRFIYRDPVALDEERGQDVAREIADLRVSDGAGDGADLLRAVRDAALAFDEDVPAGARQPKVAFVFTDLQRASWLEGDELADPEVGALARELADHEVTLNLLDYHAPDLRNATVIDLSIDRALAGVGLSTQVRARVKNQGDLPLEDVACEILLDGAVQTQETIQSLAPGETHIVEASLLFREPGSHVVSARLRGDPLEADDLRSLAIDVVRAVEVLLVDGSGGRNTERASHYLEPALGRLPDDDRSRDRSSAFQPRTVGLDALATTDLDPYGAVVLADCISFGSTEARELREYVDGGGNVVFFPGPSVDPTTWNSGLLGPEDGATGEADEGETAGVLPARMGRRESIDEPPAARIVPDDPFDHPAVRPFGEAGRAAALLQGEIAPYFRRYFVLEPVEGSRVLMRLDRPLADEPNRFDPNWPRTPFLVERRIGDGRVYLFASSAQPVGRRWNTLLETWAGPSLLYYLLSHAVESGRSRRNLSVGEGFELIVPSSEYAEEIVVQTPADEEMETALERLPAEAGGGNRFVLRFDDTDRAGPYEIRFEGRDSDGAPVLRGTETFAVQLDPAEGNLEIATPESLQDALRPATVSVVDDEDAETLVRASRESGGNDLAWAAAVGVLALLLLESILALVFGRRTQ